MRRRHPNPITRQRLTRRFYQSPEYEAFELAGPKEVIVMNSVGPWESVGGDIKFLRLMQKKVAGLVTDGSVRDTAVLRGYGFPVFCHSTTPRQGPHVHQPWACNLVINCGGVTVRPGDAIIGDQDGAVVIPAAVAQEVYDIAHSREIIEDKRMISFWYARVLCAMYALISLICSSAMAARV